MNFAEQTDWAVSHRYTVIVTEYRNNKTYKILICIEHQQIIRIYIEN